ncbi:hypothetical protein NA56DRAFT_472395 [Hyaloscypha hepaticicola]|uniref:Uncharacterized protein n=1 Tax=Hyaloscypha hepaticicola TaxID=2082293 RepID=A0A2J6QFZ3_9HELO|nr:hypothetical protein NA56DRAFT_472395 [Hyaloscypha hepaticicola]
MGCGLWLTSCAIYLQRHLPTLLFSWYYFEIVPSHVRGQRPASKILGPLRPLGHHKKILSFAKQAQHQEGPRSVCQSRVRPDAANTNGYESELLHGPSQFPPSASPSEDDSTQVPDSRWPVEVANSSRLKFLWACAAAGPCRNCRAISVQTSGPISPKFPNE